jgi:phage tail sheath protein FI
MPEYLAPGVFVEEIDSGSKPIEGVGTNTAAFIGYAKSGEFNKPTFISSWSDFCRVFGEEDEAIVKPLCDELGITPIELISAKRASRKSLIDFAQSSLMAAIRDREQSGQKHDGKCKSWPEFVKKYDIPLGSQPFSDDSYLAYAVRGYYDNGGGRAYIVRIARQADLELYSYKPESTAPQLARPASVALGPFNVKALDAGKKGNDTTLEVTHAGDDGFTVKVTQGSKSETLGTPNKPLTVDSFKDMKSKLIEVEAMGDVATATRPSEGVFNLTGGADASSTNVLALPLSGEIANVSPEEFVGDEAKRSGMGGLTTIDDVNMVAIPDLMAGAFRRESLNGSGSTEVLNITEEDKKRILAIQSELISYCERMGDRMAVIDAVPGLNPQEVRDMVRWAPFSCDHGQAALYYPWIRVNDKLHKGEQKFVPPCGHVMGVWARVGVERGVHKAPANEGLFGAVGLECMVTKGEQEILNPDGINCIRAFPNTGIRIWGARTLATVGNPSWKYVNVRRLFNYLEKSMERGLQWVVFEPNDHDLWGRVRRNLSAFLFTEWKEGKLFGQTPDEAFYVKCDSETNPQEMIDLGRLYVEIGVNPVKPAEFVIVRIGQWAGGGETTEQG